MQVFQARAPSPPACAVRTEDAFEAVRRELKNDIDHVRKEFVDSAHASLELLRSRMSTDLNVGLEGMREQLREQLATDFAAGRVANNESLRDDIQESLREQLVEEIREGREAVREQLTVEVREARKLLADELQDALRGAAPHISKRPLGDSTIATTSVELHCKQLDESLLAERTARDTAVHALRAEIAERLKSTNEWQDQRHERLVLGIQKTLEAATDHLEKELMAKYTDSIEKELQRFKSEAPDQSRGVDQERLVSLEKRFAETENRVSEQVQGLMQELAKHLEVEHEARVNCIAEIRAEIAQYAEMPAIAQTMRDAGSVALPGLPSMPGLPGQYERCTDPQPNPKLGVTAGIVS